MDNIINLSNVHYNRALEFMNNSEVSNALEELEFCLKCYSKDVQVLNLMGMCQYLLCNFDKAYFYWMKSKESEIKDNRAINYINVLQSNEFNSVIQKYNLALEEIEKGHYSESIKELKSVVKSNNELVEPYAIIGLCYWRLKKYELAEEYIKYALDRDKGNKKYLIYMNQVSTLKLKPSRNKKLLSGLVLVILVVSLCATSTLYFNKTRKFIILSNEIANVNDKLDEMNLSYNDKLNKYKKINKELEDEKLKNKLLEQKIELTNKTNEIEKYKDSESDIFNNAISNLREKYYNEAKVKFTYILNYGVEENLVAESMFFLAICEEHEENYVKAEEYYNNYIEKYKDRNYYDDSLYNLGLVLYKQGRRVDAKKVLNILKVEAPESIFINSKVEYILNN